MMPDVIKKMDLVIRINQKVAESTGKYYLVYLRQVFQDLI